MARVTEAVVGKYYSYGKHLDVFLFTGKSRKGKYQFTYVGNVKKNHKKQITYKWAGTEDQFRFELIEVTEYYDIKNELKMVKE